MTGCETGRRTLYKYIKPVKSKNRKILEQFKKCEST